MDKPASDSKPIVQIVIAIISLIGSISVAWVTTGATFEAKLHENETMVGSLNNKVESFGGEFKALSRQRDEATQQLHLLMEQREESTKQLNDLTAKQKEAELQFANLQSSLNAVKKQNEELVATLNATENQANTIKENVRMLRVQVSSETMERSPSQIERMKTKTP